MTLTTALLTAAAVAWTAQIILGYWQISRFNNAYAELARHSTYLGVGRSNGRFTPKILIILALDGDKRVSDSILMQGLTIFAAPQKLTQLHGMDYRDIDPAAIFPDKPVPCSTRTEPWPNPLTANAVTKSCNTSYATAKRGWANWRKCSRYRAKPSAKT